jgi:hypothetical protein
MPHGEHLEALRADSVIDVVPRPTEKHAPQADCAFASGGPTERGHEHDGREHALELGHEEVG